MRCCGCRHAASGAALLAESTRQRTSFDYAPLQQVLTSYVDAEGRVDYAALKRNRGDLDKMSEQISAVSPDNKPQLFPTREAKLAYWINAYNTWILRIVVDNYPTSSITKIGLIPYGAFFVKRVSLGGEKLTLRSLENDIIRARFHDPSRIEPQVVAMKKSIPGKTPKEAVSEKSGSGSGDSGLRGLLDGRFGADHPLGERMCSVGCKWLYIFNLRMAKKLIPANNVRSHYREMELR
jgi:Protein of unknown function, DUF547